MYDPNILRDRMLLMMGKLDITWAEIERKTDIHHSTLQKWAYHGAIPKAHNLISVADLFGVNPAWLLGMSEVKYVGPVTHGHWKVVFVTNAKSIEKNYYCSQCGDNTHYAYKRNYDYCPDCGSRMDEEVRE